MTSAPAEADAQRRQVRSDRRMSDAEALMWNVEKDPSLRSTFLNVTFLDRPPDFDGFRRRIERATVEIPRLRQRVQAAPAHLAPPEWVDDPAFDLDFHVRRISLGGGPGRSAPVRQRPAFGGDLTGLGDAEPSSGPAGDRELLDLAALGMQDPFDRARPLWQFTIVDGLAGGRAALLAKMHHTITDGVGGVRLSAMFLDLERDAPAPDLPAPGEPNPLAPGFADAAVRALLHGARRQLGISRRAAAALVGLALRPQDLPSIAAIASDTAQSVLRQLFVTDGARSPLWAGRRSLGRRFEVLTVDLDRLKAQANALGGTVNDAFVSCVAGGAGTYHRERGVEIDELRAAMPVSTRGDRSAGGNAFAPTRVLVPAGTKDPVERFHAVRQRLGTTRRERAIGLVDALSGALNLLPTSIVTNVARQQAETIDFAVSNIRGAPFDLYVAGAEVLHNHPMGPTAGTAFNATVLSYRGQLDLGLNIDTAAVDAPVLLRDCIDESFHEFLALNL